MSMSSPSFISVEETLCMRHFLDACFLCKKPISKNEDIFMYRGDAPFCSEECRWQQIDMDEALESDRVTSSAYAAAAASSTSTMKRKPSLIGAPSKRAEEKNYFDIETVATAG